MLETGKAAGSLSGTSGPGPFRDIKTSLKIIRLAVMMYVRFPLPRRDVEDPLLAQGIDICREAVRGRWRRSGPLQTFASVHDCGLQPPQPGTQTLPRRDFRGQPHCRSRRVARSLRGIETASLI